MRYFRPARTTRPTLTCRLGIPGCIKSKASRGCGNLGISGWMKICLGEHNTAIEHEARAMRLSPLDPLLWAWQHFTALAHFFERRYDTAASWVEATARAQPSFLPALRFAAASNALGGRPEQAQKFMARLRQLDPALRISNLADVMIPLRPEDFSKLTEGLRKAGLPE
jgi:tetratricopeptide (TPR) repeat protein